MKVSNIKIQTIGVNLEHEAFAKVPKDLVPTSVSHHISFQLENVNAAVANAVRVCTMEEIEWKALYVETSDIVCNEPGVLLTELCDRIGLIPINQDIPNDTRFSLHAANDASSLTNVTVYSGDLIRSGGGGSSSGSKRKSADFDERFRLVSLSPGKTIQINNIRVVTGYGFENAKFNTCGFEYDTMDHIEVHYLSEKEQILSHMTAVSDIVAEMKRLKHKVTDTHLYGKRIIAIPNTDILKACPDNVRDRVKNRFDIILENTKLQPTSSSIAKPKHFYIAFKFFAEVDPLLVMRNTMQSLKDRLLAIKTHIDAHMSAQTAQAAQTAQTSVEITVSGHDAAHVSIAEILVRGEDHVIGNLIVKTILELDPKIAGVLYKIIHPSNRSMIIKVMHSQPLKIVVDAITRCHDNFDSLQRQFTKK